MNTLESLETLENFAIDETIIFQELTPDYPVVHITNSHAKASIALHGAHVLEYTPTSQRPVIFTSESAIYEEGTAIRGGIPVCWPWFSAHPTDKSLPSHGYARKAFWKLFRTFDNKEGTTLIFTFSENELHAELTIKVGESLDLELKTTNTGSESVVIGGALHTYLNISDIENISISGLDQASYIDSLTDTSETQNADITIDEEVDRVYTDTDHTVSLYDKAWNRSLIVEKTGSLSTVIWNPWIDKAAELKDLGDDEYKKFVCIEATNALEDVYRVAPGSSHILGTTITAV